MAVGTIVVRLTLLVVALLVIVQGSPHGASRDFWENDDSHFETRVRNDLHEIDLLPRRTSYDWDAYLFRGKRSIPSADFTALHGSPSRVLTLAIDSDAETLDGAFFTVSSPAFGMLSIGPFEHSSDILAAPPPPRPYPVQVLPAEKMVQSTESRAGDVDWIISPNLPNIN